jgi:hypothetical protein
VTRAPLDHPEADAPVEPDGGDIRGADQNGDALHSEAPGILKDGGQQEPAHTAAAQAWIHSQPDQVNLAADLFEGGFRSRVRLASAARCRACRSRAAGVARVARMLATRPMVLHGFGGRQYTLSFFLAR